MLCSLVSSDRTVSDPGADLARWANPGAALLVSVKMLLPSQFSHIRGSPGGVEHAVPRAKGSQLINDAHICLHGAVLTPASSGVSLPEGSLLRPAALQEQAMAAPVVLFCPTFLPKIGCSLGALRCSASFRRAPATCAQVTPSPAPCEAEARPSTHGMQPAALCSQRMEAFATSTF